MSYFFFNDTATTEIYTLSLHDALPIFAHGDRKTLKNLLSRDVYDGFDRAIAERERRGEKAETTFVSIDKAELVGVEVRNRVAQVTVRFLSKLITATREDRKSVV